MRLGLQTELRGAGLSLRIEQLDQLPPLRRAARWCVQGRLGAELRDGQTRTSDSLDALDVLARCPRAPGARCTGVVSPLHARPELTRSARLRFSARPVFER